MCLFFIGDARGVSGLKRTIVVSVFGMICLALFEFLYFPSTGAFSGRLHSDFTVLDPNELAAVTVMALPLALEPFFRGAGGAGVAARQLAALLLAAASLLAIWYSPIPRGADRPFRRDHRRAPLSKTSAGGGSGRPSCLASSSLGISGS